MRNKSFCVFLLGKAKRRSRKFSVYGRSYFLRIIRLNASNSRRSAPNNGIHPTRDTLPVIKSILVGGRVMPGVRFLRVSKSCYGQNRVAEMEDEFRKPREPCSATQVISRLRGLLPVV